MDEYVGISFTNRSLSVALAKTQNQQLELISTQEMLYPFPFEFNALLKKENLEILSEKLSAFIESNNLKDHECFISLPMFLAQMKRFPLPEELDTKILQKHFVWELENLGATAVEQTKVIKLAHEFSFGSYEESAFYLIPKSTVDKVKNFIEKTGLKLKRMILDSDTILKFLKSYNLLHPAKNQLVFQVDVFSVSSFAYLDGNFYSYDLSTLSEIGNSFEENVLEIIKEKISSLQQIINTLPGYEYNIDVYITRLTTNELMQKLNEGEVNAVEINLAKILEQDITTKNIEPFAVML